MFFERHWNFVVGVVTVTIATCAATFSGLRSPVDVSQHEDLFAVVELPDVLMPTELLVDMPQRTIDSMLGEINNRKHTIGAHYYLQTGGSERFSVRLNEPGIEPKNYKHHALCIFLPGPSYANFAGGLAYRQLSFQKSVGKLAVDLIDKQELYRLPELAKQPAEIQVQQFGIYGLLLHSSGDMPSVQYVHPELENWSKLRLTNADVKLVNSESALKFAANPHFFVERALLRSSNSKYWFFTSFTPATKDSFWFSFAAPPAGSLEYIVYQDRKKAELREGAGYCEPFTYSSAHVQRDLTNAIADSNPTARKYLGRFAGQEMWTLSHQIIRQATDDDPREPGTFVVHHQTDEVGNDVMNQYIRSIYANGLHCPMHRCGKYAILELMTCQGDRNTFFGYQHLDLQGRDMGSAMGGVAVEWRTLCALPSDDDMSFCHAIVLNEETEVFYFIKASGTSVQKIAFLPADVSGPRKEETSHLTFTVLPDQAENTSHLTVATLPDQAEKTSHLTVATLPEQAENTSQLTFKILLEQPSTLPKNAQQLDLFTCYGGRIYMPEKYHSLNWSGTPKTYHSLNSSGVPETYHSLNSSGVPETYHSLNSSGKINWTQIG